MQHGKRKVKACDDQNLEAVLLVVVILKRVKHFAIRGQTLVRSSRVGVVDARGRREQRSRHVRPFELVSETGVVRPDPDPGNNGKLLAAVLLARDPLCLFHEERADPLMLEESRISRVQRDRSSVDCA